MPMISPRLQHDIDRRVRAAYSLNLDRGFGGRNRSSSVPAALRHHQQQKEDSSRAVTAPDGYRGRRASTARTRLIKLAKPERMARSESPPHVHMEQRSPSNEEPDASVLDFEEAPLTSEDSLSGPGVRDTSRQGSPVVAADVTEKAESREEEGAMTPDFGAPKLMKLMEERDRAVHLCLQYRCKLKNTEGSLRAEECLASDLKGQLREAIAAGEATRKLFDQVMDKVRAAEGRRLRQETDTRLAQDGDKNARFAEEARKTRLQLARARKDLRGLWLERDELAMLAGEAIQGEQASCKRVKKLELAIVGLREQVAALALSEQKAIEEMARAKARATAAEAAESELRKAVEAIKHDFEALVRDLRLREKTIRQLEAKNATLSVKSVAPTPAPQERVRWKQISAEDGISVEDNRSAVLPTRRESSDDGPKEAQFFLESRASSVDRPTAGGVSAKENGMCGEAAPYTQATSLDQRGTSAHAPMASISRPERKKLTPQGSEVPGRVTTISYPRCGIRTTFTPAAAPKTAPEMGCNGGGSTTSLREADDQRGEESSAGSGLAQSAVGQPKDLGRLSNSKRIECEDKQLKASAAQHSPRQQPSQETTGAVDHSPSSQDTRQSQTPCPLSLSLTPKPSALPNHPSRSSTVEMPNVSVNLGTPVVRNAQDIAGEGGGHGGDGAMHTEGGRSADFRKSSDNLVGGGRATAPAPIQAPATAEAGVGELDRTNPLPNNGEVGGVEQGWKLGLEVDVDSPVPVPPSLDEVGAGSDTPAFRPRLVDGVPVLKYGGARGKPKPKVLWVTPDFSEIFYTQTGRTTNSKKSSHMPLAGLCASRGRRDCPDLLRAPTDDRCFALVQADCLAGGKGDREGDPDKHSGNGNGNGNGNESDGGGDSPGPGRRKWGIGGTLPANLAHGKRWRGSGAEAGVVPAGTTSTTATTRKLTAGTTPSPGGRRGRGRAAVETAGRAARETMGLETTSAEECTSLVDEINELVRRAGMKHGDGGGGGGGGSSTQGRDLSVEWARSAEARRDVDAHAHADTKVGAEADC